MQAGEDLLKLVLPSQVRLHPGVRILLHWPRVGDVWGFWTISILGLMEIPLPGGHHDSLGRLEGWQPGGFKTCLQIL